MCRVLRIGGCHDEHREGGFGYHFFILAGYIYNFDPLCTKYIYFDFLFGRGSACKCSFVFPETDVFRMTSLIPTTSSGQAGEVDSGLYQARDTLSSCLMPAFVKEEPEVFASMVFAEIATATLFNRRTTPEIIQNCTRL